MNKIIFGLVLLISSGVFGQDSIGVKKELFKVNFLASGFVYEYGLSDKMSLHSNISIGFFWKYSKLLGSTTGFNVNITEQLRYYYNFERRSKKNKIIKNNSANYFALYGSASSKPFAGSNLENYIYYSNYTTGVVYGINRFYGKRFTDDFNFGLGFAFSENSKPSFIPIINYSFGIIIFDKKSLKL